MPIVTHQIKRCSYREVARDFHILSVRKFPIKEGGRVELSSLRRMPTKGRKLVARNANWAANEGSSDPELTFP